jgi:hypothetical protein
MKIENEKEETEKYIKTMKIILKESNMKIIKIKNARMREYIIKNQENQKIINLWKNYPINNYIQKKQVIKEGKKHI